MIFKNRIEAARQLAEKLSEYRGRNPLVLAVPRGAVPMGKVIAEALGGELDVVLVHKLRAPGEPELAIGSIDEMGRVRLADYIDELNVGNEYLEGEKRFQLESLRRRRESYTPIRPPIDPIGRIAIIVDDGIATGASMLAAIAAVREKKPAKLIVATAVAPPDTVDRLAAQADEVVCLATPVPFYAIGRFFDDFSEVSDREVVEILGQKQSAAVRQG